MFEFVAIIFTIGFIVIFIIITTPKGTFSALLTSNSGASTQLNNYSKETIIAIKAVLMEIYPNATNISYDGCFDILFNPDENNGIHKIQAWMYDDKWSNIKEEALYKQTNSLDFLSSPIPEYMFCGRKYHLNNKIAIEEYFNSNVQLDGVTKFYNKEGVLIKEEEYRNDKLINTVNISSN